MCRSAHARARRARTVSSSAPPALKRACSGCPCNARPIFLGERVFALLGYELVECRLFGHGESERITERRRISFAPLAAVRGSRPAPFD